MSTHPTATSRERTTLDVVVDPTVPPDEVHLRDQDGTTVGRILNVDDGQQRPNSSSACAECGGTGTWPHRAGEPAWPFHNLGCTRRAPGMDTPINDDTVNHPAHYNAHPAGIECIDVVEHMNFNRGNAIKYIWRAGAKGNELEDLQKARWYVDREIHRLSSAAAPPERP
jgi:hypothetical protein